LEQSQRGNSNCTQQRKGSYYQFRQPIFIRFFLAVCFNYGKFNFVFSFLFSSTIFLLHSFKKGVYLGQSVLPYEENIPSSFSDNSCSSGYTRLRSIIAA
jgi:hypothetical protein